MHLFLTVFIRSAFYFDSGFGANIPLTLLSFLYPSSSLPLPGHIPPTPLWDVICPRASCEWRKHLLGRSGASSAVSEPAEQSDLLILVNSNLEARTSSCEGSDRRNHSDVTFIWYHGGKSHFLSMYSNFKSLTFKTAYRSVSWLWCSNTRVFLCGILPRTFWSWISCNDHFCRLSLWLWNHFAPVSVLLHELWDPRSHVWSRRPRSGWAAAVPAAGTHQLFNPPRSSVPGSYLSCREWCSSSGRAAAAAAPLLLRREASCPRFDPNSGTRSVREVRGRTPPWVAGTAETDLQSVLQLNDGSELGAGKSTPPSPTPPPPPSTPPFQIHLALLTWHPNPRVRAHRNTKDRLSLSCKTEVRSAEMRR